MVSFRAPRQLLLLVVCLGAVCLGVGPLAAQDIVLDRDDFAGWSYPEGLVTLDADGFSVRAFGTSFNAVVDVDEHESVVIGNFGQRPVRTPSNAFSADRIRDQDAATWWQPSPEDDPQTWWIELDLGRAVVADRLRVRFPDEEGARPFRFFSVYTSPGIPVFGDAPRIVYNRVGRPINDNTEQVVEFDLETTGLRGASGAFLDTNATMPFDIVRFVRFEASSATRDAALAEIEVDAVGFNLSSMVGTPTRRDNGEPHWGGTTWTSKDRDCEGCGKGSGADEMLDEDLGFRQWTTESEDKGDWRNSGVWQVIDFGNVYRVNRVIFLPIVAGRSPIIYGFERDKQGPWAEFDLLTSDGTASSVAVPEVEGPFHYELLTEVANGTNPNQDPRYRSHFGRHLFDFQFPPRDVRLLLWRVVRLRSAFSRALQLFAFHAEGYPAQVEMESADIPLGAAVSLRAVEWDADIPPGTAIRVSTQTGNGYTTVRRYFLINGVEVTKEAYDSAKSRNRGDITETRVRDETWSDWSEVHRFSGQDFQSPSPRQWLRVRVRLLSDDEGLRMPTLRSLRFLASSPVIAAGLQGEVFPKEAVLDSLQAFRYTVQPLGTNPADMGFNRIGLALPPGIDLEFLRATVAGETVPATAERLSDPMSGDSLLVDLQPSVVRRDSVEIHFHARLVDSPTSFDASVSNVAAQGRSQGVVPAAFGADLVYVPEAVAGRDLVRNLRHAAVFSPNGDGINDELVVDFTVVKTASAARVRVFDLAGRAVADLANDSPDSRQASFRWDGHAAGRPVPPGLYVLRIEVQADAGGHPVQRAVSVAY
jgi:gliding motility-associated-like protein